MDDQQIISILKQARSIKPNKRWDGIAREAMLVYTQEEHKRSSGLFGILTRYNKAPYFILGCAVVGVILVTGGSSITIPEQEGEKGSKVAIVSQAPQPQTDTKPKNDTTQEVMSFLVLDEDKSVTSYIQTPAPDKSPYTTTREDTEKAFNEYLAELERLDAIDPDNQDILENAMKDVQEKAEAFIASLQLGEIKQEDVFEHALRIAVAYRQNLCRLQEDKDTIGDLLSQSTVSALIQANSISIHCEKTHKPITR